MSISDTKKKKFLLFLDMLDMNVKFNFNATFINIFYAYLQPFRRNFYFLNKIFFFLLSIVLFEFLFKNRIAINSKYVTTK
jgi:hypothetical protein